MKDIKKRFIDILFEPDDEEEEEVFEEPVKAEPSKKETTGISAKDILYRKPEQSAFINLEETISTVKNTKSENSSDYEFSSQISPIFGVLKDNSQNVVKNEVDTNESFINKPEDSHLDIITSPIYGYGTKDDIKDNNTYESDEDELHRLLDDETDSDYNPYEYSHDNINDEYLNYTTREDEDEDDITLFDMYEDDE